MSLENLFRSPAKQEKSAAEKKDKKRNLLDLAKIATMLAMFAWPSQAEGQEASGSEKKEDKMELAQQYLKKIREYIHAKTAGSEQFLNGIRIDEHHFPSGQIVTAAENGSFLVVSEDGGQRAFIDWHSDGQPDRLVVNKAAYEANKLQTEEDGRRLDDDLYLMREVGEMKKSIQVEAMLMPKDISVLDLDRTGKAVTMLDYGDGSIGRSQEEEEYQQIQEKMQDAYFVRLAELAKAAEAGN